MITSVEAYLALRRAAGFSLINAEYLLRSYARFAGEREEAFVRTATTIEWACHSPSIAQRHTRYQTVYRFAEHARIEEPRHELPPQNHFGYRSTRRVPHIYSAVEIERLIRAAMQLPPAGSLRSHTYATLIALLAATGMRVSEALDLLLTDIHGEALLIRKTKFQKTRVVPLHDTALAGLRRYLACRKRIHRGGEHVFITDDGHRLPYQTVHTVFCKLLKAADLVPASGRAPRLHELRHTLAVRALEQCPFGRHRIGLHMVALATYMGHVNIDSTYWYLQSTPELLDGIASAGEDLLYGGRP